jgi:hypothetical protein
MAYCAVLGHIWDMSRSMFGRRGRRDQVAGSGLGWNEGPRRRWRPKSRAGGCLLWIVLLILVLIVLSVLFGGFQKGTKAGGLGFGPVAVVAVRVVAVRVVALR